MEVLRTVYVNLKVSHLVKKGPVKAYSAKKRIPHNIIQKERKKVTKKFI